MDGVEAGLAVTAGMDFLRMNGGEDLREHYLWSLKQLMADLPPEKLSTSALVALHVILIPEHARAIREIGGRPSGAVIRLLRPTHSTSNGHSPADLCKESVVGGEL